MDYQTSIKELKGIGEKNGALFHKLHIDTLYDLLTFFPRAYESHPALTEATGADNDKRVAVFATLKSEPKLTHIKKYQILSFIASDEKDQCFHVRIFNMPYLKKTLHAGQRYVFYGKMTQGTDHLSMDQPKLFKPEEYFRMLEGYFPIYPCTKGLSNETIRKYIRMAYEILEEQIRDPFPDDLIQKRGFPSYRDMVRIMHNPDSMDEVFRAKKRLAYEEFFFFLLSTRQNESGQVKKTEVNCFQKYEEVDAFIAALPFKLTDSQLRAWKEIEQDLCSHAICNRLVQGDVGCGKTMIAILALYSCVLNGKQGALMVPTEVLAQQHFQSITEMTKQYGLPFRIALLTGSVKAKDKKQIYAELSDGTVNLVIGTHALLEEPVVFRDLGLVVTDEQHRFGVRQRAVLHAKGQDVHTIVMSATPIPRSLAMILYGGMNVSTIPELPAHRLPIKNAVVDIGYRKSAYHFMKQQIREGRQIYIICPMVEAGISEDLENVEEYAEKIRPFFDETVRIAVLHGKMKGTDKNRILNEFASHEIDILVSTTVVEVGINVPNATVMMIENAERFGLAALHQLRGRVGRGKYQSYCIFVDSTASEKSKKRLDILGKTNDGFEIANADLKMRGPGELSGTLQSGDAGFVYADLYDDADMLYLANEDIGTLIMDDPLLEDASHMGLRQKWMEYTEHGYLRTI